MGAALTPYPRDGRCPRTLPARWGLPSHPTRERCARESVVRHHSPTSARPCAPPARLSSATASSTYSISAAWPSGSLSGPLGEIGTKTTCHAPRADAHTPSVQCAHGRLQSACTGARGRARRARRVRRPIDEI
eukprot:6394025-Prymnesium_polylepis.2